MPTQDRFDEEIDAVADNCERDSLFSAATMQRKNALIDRKVSGKLDEHLSIRLDEFDLTRKTLLTRDLTSQPSCLPLPPRREGEGFEHGISGIHPGDCAIKVAKDICHIYGFEYRPLPLFFNIRDQDAPPLLTHEVHDVRARTTLASAIKKTRYLREMWKVVRGEWLM